MPLYITLKLSYCSHCTVVSSICSSTEGVPSLLAQVPRRSRHLWWLHCNSTDVRRLWWLCRQEAIHCHDSLRWDPIRGDTVPLHPLDREGPPTEPCRYTGRCARGECCSDGLRQQAHCRHVQVSLYVCDLMEYSLLCLSICLSIQVCLRLTSTPPPPWHTHTAMGLVALECSLPCMLNWSDSRLRVWSMCSSSSSLLVNRGRDSLAVL